MWCYRYLTCQWQPLILTAWPETRPQGVQTHPPDLRQPSSVAGQGHSEYLYNYKMIWQLSKLTLTNWKPFTHSYKLKTVKTSPYHLKSVKNKPHQFKSVSNSLVHLKTVKISSGDLKNCHNSESVIYENRKISPHFLSDKSRQEIRHQCTRKNMEIF